MSTLKINNNSLVINNKPVFIYSGEMHYFRIRKQDWPDRIKKAKKANLNTISSYIPWRWHSPMENIYDFNGNSFPGRDLEHFLSILKKEKMYFIARIGPITHGEIINDGLPEWLFQKYPEVRLKDYAGRTNPYSSMVDYHNPTYHEQIKIWYSKLIPILQKYLITEGGPIILIQLDNEISMINWLAKSPTYSDYSNTLFQNYLKNKFLDIQTLNKECKTDFQSFGEIKQPDGNFQKELGVFYCEWEEYYREFYALYYKKLYEYLSVYKIELPVIANIPQIYDYDVKGRGNMGIMTTLMFKRFSKYVNNIIFGGAYQYRRVDYENFTDITAMSEIVRMITPKDNPMICAEMQTGIMFDRPVLYPSDVELNIKTSTATGLNGINMYMFAGGENYLNMGGFGTFHNWQAAVSDKGKLAPHYEPIKEIGEFFQNWHHLLPDTKNVHEINIGLYTPYYQTEYLKGIFPEELMFKRDSKFFDGLLRLIRLAGYNYQFIDLKDTPKEKLLLLDNLWIFSLEFMDKNTQEKIIELVEANKKLLFYPTIPEYNLNFDPCDVLKSFLGISQINPNQIGANRIKKANSEYLYYGGDEIRSFELMDSQLIKLLFLTESNKTAAFYIPSKNIVVCGFDLIHKFDFQIDFVKAFAEILNIKNEIINPNKRVNVILRHSDKADVLFITNYTEMEEKTKINLKKNPFPVELPINAPGRKCNILFTNYEINPDLKLYFITGEIIKLTPSKKDFKLIIKSITPEVDLCYQGKYKIKSTEKIKVMKQSNKYSMAKIYTNKGRFELIFKKYN